MTDFLYIGYVQAIELHKHEMHIPKPEERLQVVIKQTGRLEN